MKSKIAVLVSMMLALLMASLDTTIMNTTMPLIAKSLGGFDLFAWPFATYMIATTVLAPVAGRLSDLYGRKQVFASGMIVFLIGSLLCGLSQTMIQLVIFRGIQGIGAGFMMPFPAIIAGDLFSVEKRGKIQAIGTSMWGLSAVIAPLLGAFFVEHSTWRWIFFVNIPIALLALVALLPYREEYTPKKAQIDYIGTLLFTTGVTLLLLVTVVDRNPFVYGLAGALFVICFYFFEKRQSSSLIPFSIFRDKTLRWMNINGFLGWAALFGAASYIPLFLQNMAHLTIFTSGIVLLGTAIGWITASVPTGTWILKYGYRPLFIIGNALLAFSGVLLALLHEESGFWYVFIVMIIQGLAFGMLSTTGVIGAQQLVQAHEKGISTSFMMFSRNIGTAIGVTIMGAFLSKSEDFMSGMYQLFLYGLMGSLLAFVTSFFIKDRQSVK
ncbi:MFS transporter [Brevibacillus brevis]|uniref:MFS transporter n=1 Tax=Brevibacillus brevis TaxID=1393 RepID=UPI000D0E7935|nr:MFS transporter [Brevibacillus brevis]PSJ68224.1 major facilitator superfamily transporter [Brevibacillus brevis]RED35730.1 EmrB/QacA subfamily drug resistance transporter [Brevibacillus brevis]GEC89273.1 MFS transporter [Brevibacillus brevis]VEF89159.1 Multidrug-efflux transporter 3 [Brevibacillus brevis]